MALFCLFYSCVSNPIQRGSLEKILIHSNLSWRILCFWNYMLVLIFIDMFSIQWSKVNPKKIHIHSNLLWRMLCVFFLHIIKCSCNYIVSRWYVALLLLVRYPWELIHNQSTTEYDIPHYNARKYITLESHIHDVWDVDLIIVPLKNKI